MVAGRGVAVAIDIDHDFGIVEAKAVPAWPEMMRRLACAARPGRGSRVGKPVLLEQLAGDLRTCGDGVFEDLRAGLMALRAMFSLTVSCVGGWSEPPPGMKRKSPPEPSTS